jgi:hypothetical protein
MKAYRGVVAQYHTFLSSALDGGEWSASCPGHFTPRGNCRRYPLDGMLGGLRAGLDAVEKINSLAFAGTRTLIVEL